MAGSRTCIPLMGGMLMGALLAMLLLSPEDTTNIGDAMCASRNAPKKEWVTKKPCAALECLLDRLEALSTLTVADLSM